MVVNLILAWQRLCRRRLFTDEPAFTVFEKQVVPALEIEHDPWKFQPIRDADQKDERSRNGDDDHGFVSDARNKEQKEHRCHKRQDEVNAPGVLLYRLNLFFELGRLVVEFVPRRRRVKGF